MAQAILRYATPIRDAQFELARMTIVCVAAMALICAGRALPF
jgi:hypothetical protein